MDLAPTWMTIQNLLSSNVLNLLAALTVFVLGWILALIISTRLKGLIDRFELEKLVSQWLFEGEDAPAQRVFKWLHRLIYLGVLLTVLITGFKLLQIEAVNDQLDFVVGMGLGFAAKFLKPVLLLATAWVVATAIRFFIIKISGKAKLEDRILSQMNEEDRKTVNVTETFADTVYWLVFLVFLPAILESLALQSLMGPFNSMVETIIDYLPNLFGAAVIFFIGWFLGKIVQRVLSNLLRSLGLDRMGEKAGVSGVLGDKSLSEAVGVIAYVLILIPVLISTLNALKLEAVTAPASAMLNEILNLLPNIFGAIVLVFIAYFVGKIARQFAIGFLKNVGFDNILVKMELSKEPMKKGDHSPSEIVGFLVIFAVILFAAIEALNMLGLETLAEITNKMMGFGANVLLGLFVFAIGLYLANLAGKAVGKSSLAHASILAVAARGSIVVLTGAMALKEMGIAGEIVNITFGIILGGFALAFGLAVGLGGKDVAAKYLKNLEEFWKAS